MAGSPEEALPFPPNSLATVVQNPGRREQLVPTMEEIQLAYKESWGFGGRPKPRPLEMAPFTPQPARIDVVEESPRDAGATKVQAATIIRELFRRPRGVPVEQAPASVTARGGVIALSQDPPSEHGGTSSRGSWMGAGGSTSESGSANGAKAAGGLQSRAEQTRIEEAPLEVGSPPGSYAPRRPAPETSGSLQNRGVTLHGQEDPSGHDETKPADRESPAAGASVSATLDGVSAEPASSTPAGGSPEEVTSLTRVIELASRQVALASSVTDLDVGLPLYDPQKERGGTANVSVGLVAEKGAEELVSEDPAVAGFEWLLEADPVLGEEAERGTTFDDRSAAGELEVSSSYFRNLSVFCVSKSFSSGPSRGKENLFIENSHQFWESHEQGCLHPLPQMHGEIGYADSFLNDFALMFDYPKSIICIVLTVV